jgi:hypothetical protein
MPSVAAVYDRRTIASKRIAYDSECDGHRPPLQKINPRSAMPDKVWSRRKSKSRA